MDINSWKIIQDKFHKALELPKNKRNSFIQTCTTLDEESKQNILLLLAKDNDTDQVDSVRKEISAVLTKSQLPQISGYDILEKIASGGMGEVFKAWDTRLSRNVAIKLLHSHRSQQEKAKKRFYREARACAKINHENICPIFEIAETNKGSLYIVTAFCEGMNLSKKIHENTLTISETLSIFEQLLSALRAAHSEGIVHRDLKPENIIIDNNNRIQLVDFGIARNVDDYQTITGEILGTPDYMSPEQFRGEAFDALSDIWSCGIILYELFKGTSPYSGKSAPEIIYAMLHEHIIFAISEEDDLWPIYKIVNHCLQTDKNLRPANIDSLLDMLANARNDLVSKNILNTVPDYEIKILNNDIQKHQYSSSLSTQIQRKIVHICLKTPNLKTKKSRSDLYLVLREICIKYRGFIGSNDFYNNQDSLYLSAFFGYPIADALKTSNAIHCGWKWISALKEQEIECSILGGFENIIEHEKKFITDFSFQESIWITHRLIKDIKQSGFWLMEKLTKSIRGNRIEIDNVLTLKVQDSSVDCHQVSQVTPPDRVTITDSKSNFIGRDAQLSLLLESWEQALEGDPQRILISGEAGIGKSRLIYELKQAIQELHEDQNNINLIELDCSPYEKVSTYYPILQYLKRRISSQHPTSESQFNKTILLDYIGSCIQSSDVEKLLFCKLMGNKLSQEEQANLPTGDLLSRQYQELLIRLLLHRENEETTLLIIEDLHWADTSTRVIVEKLLQSSSSQDSMILMSSRPEYKPAWLSNVITSNLYLSKLRDAYSEKLLKSVMNIEYDGKYLVENKMLLRQIVERTGGNPLFIEEMAKTIFTLNKQPQLSHSELPETIQDTLIARLEKLGVSQYMAQYAAVIGRDFDLKLLRLCQDESDSEFSQQLDTLIKADILHQVRDEQYRFKHALIRDAAYQMIAPDSRKKIHQLIAITLKTHFIDVTETQPELLAQHWEISNCMTEALDWWLVSAQRNLQLSAIGECLDNCDHAHNLIKQLDDKSHANLMSLKVYKTHVPALMNRYGYADDKINDACKKAVTLCEELGKNKENFPFLFGLWTYDCVKAQHGFAKDLSKKMVQLSKGLGDFERCEAYLTMGINLFYRGKFVEAQAALISADDFYHKNESERHILIYGQDPKVVFLNFQGWNECLLGNFEAAIIKSNTAVEFARDTEHPLSIAYALSFSAWTKLNCGMIDDAEHLVKEAIDISEEHEILLFLGLSLSLYALTLFAKQSIKEGNEVMQRAEEVYFSTGAAVSIPSFLTAKAEVSMMQNDIKSASQQLQQSLSFIEDTDERFGLVPTLALLSKLYSINNEGEKAIMYKEKTINAITEQKALGWKLILEKKGFVF